MYNFLYIRLSEPGGCIGLHLEQSVNDAHPSGSSVLTVGFEPTTSRIADQIRGANHSATFPLIIIFHLFFLVPILRVFKVFAKNFQHLDNKICHPAFNTQSHKVLNISGNYLMNIKQIFYNNNNK